MNAKQNAVTTALILIDICEKLNARNLTRAEYDVELCAQAKERGIQQKITVDLMEGLFAGGTHNTQTNIESQPIQC